MKYPFLVMAIAYSSLSFAQESICSPEEQTGYHPLPESYFTSERASESVTILEEFFSGERQLDVEFIWQANILIEGAFLRREYERLKGGSDYEKVDYAKMSFCDFMRTKAYAMH